MQVLLILVNGAAAFAFGLGGSLLALVFLLFCDSGPVSLCLAYSLVALLLSAGAVAMSVTAIVAMRRNDDSMVWYLKVYPLAYLLMGAFMFLRQEILWIPFVAFSYAGLSYIFGLRRARN